MRAYSGLAHAPKKQRVELLAPALDDPNAAIRTAAVHALAECEDAQEYLTNALESDSSADVRNAAVAALASLSSDNTTALLNALTDASARVREAALGALSAAGYTPDRADIMQTVHDDEHLHTRRGGNTHRTTSIERIK